MLQSKLFGKINKAAREYGAANATFLIKGGFISQTMAGVYSFLPLGWRVLNKIENIIRAEMDKVGQELFLPAIAPKEMWEKADRFNTIDVLFKVVPANKGSKALNDCEYVLNATHEDIVTPLAKNFNFSYKDLPFAIYQIQTKFRNEPRPKSGLLRGREFRMKDLYSFHTDEKDLQRYYEEVKKAYSKTFDRLGIGQDTVIAAASGGDFTKGFSHEFQTKCETGEDVIFEAKKAKVIFNKEVAPAKAPDLPQETEMKELKHIKGVGIIGVEELSKFLKIPPEKSIKTLIYKTPKDEIIVACVRGVYDINEEKLVEAAGVESIELADDVTVKKTTGAETGYAGILNLPKDVKLFVDESIEKMVNFETGANKTHYHTINVNWGRDVKKPKKFYDIKIAREGDIYPETGEKYETYKASEVGNIFPLNTKFSEAFDYKYTDEKGKQKIVYMGSYGIGSTRVMGVLVEKFHDENGIIWPEQVAPFQVHLLSLKENQKADKIYHALEEQGIEVLYDDRDISPGEKFAEADLIGIPYRLIVSKKSGSKIEMKRRGKKDSQLLDLKQIINKLK